MADLVLKGVLNLAGTLKLATSGGGKVKVGSAVALVEQASGTAPPVIIPPPPAPKPLDDGPNVNVITSFTKTVTANGKAIVTQGMVMQGAIPTWPGMVLPSQGNATVTINRLAINVENDKAIIFPSGGSASLSQSGQS